ncbi:MAG: ABC transporter substrate-binding protein [Gammaproteobacteria bacterium]|nr:ABC transporter substrate-binding protein [Gammaproteobacteria bacterium]
MNRIAVALLLTAALAILAGVLPRLSAAVMAPNDFVQEAVDELAEKIEGRHAELAEDKASLYALIDEILLPRFDRRFAAGQVLAKHWRTATPEQRERFVNAFYQTLLERYADGVLEFEHERIEILPYRGDDSRRTAVVKTIVTLTDGTKVSVNYTLIDRNDQWQMFDVTIEGVSYVRNFRAELDAEIRATSVEEVIARLEGSTAGSGVSVSGSAGSSSE